MDTTTTPARSPEVIAPGSGHHLHFLNHLATVKVSAGELGAMSAIEFTAPRGFGPPLHRHRDEDELFVMLDGRIDCTAGARRLTAEEGAVVMLPSGVPHTFQVLSDTARFICVTASRTAAPTFDRMVVALGVATDVPTIPTAAYIDAAHVADVCAAHGIDVVGPPPAALPAEPVGEVR
ncbi:cupin domain-containing protein [Euzebya sp.]|uniref:cupin domain-containing protein n=1 Tax=Euzebya sp. TaxID=1971409 RepID=UPI003515D581